MKAATLLTASSANEALQRNVYIPPEITRLLSNMSRIDLQMLLLAVALLDIGGDDIEPEALEKLCIDLDNPIDMPVPLFTSVFLIKKESMGAWLTSRGKSLLSQTVDEIRVDGGFRMYVPFTEVSYLKVSDPDNPHNFPVLRISINKRMKPTIAMIRQYGRRLELYRDLKYQSGIRLLMLGMAHLKNAASVVFTISWRELATILSDESAYDRFVDFRRYVLDKAVKDIGDNSPNCELTYRAAANGKGRAITDIEITLTVRDTESVMQLVEHKLTLFLIKNGLSEKAALDVLTALGEPELQRRIDAFERDRAEGNIERDIQSGKAVSHLQRLRAMLKGSYTVQPVNEHDRELAEKQEAERQETSAHKQAKLDRLEKRHADIIEQLRGMEQKYFGELLPIAATEVKDDDAQEIRKRISVGYLAEYDIHGIAFPLRAAKNVGQRMKDIKSLWSHANTRAIMLRLSQSVLKVDGISAYYAEQGVSKYDALFAEEREVAGQINTVKSQGELL